MRGRLGAILAATTALAGAGCDGYASALDPAGPQAARVSSLFWVFFFISLLVWSFVLGVLMSAIARARRSPPRSPLDRNPLLERRLGRTILVASTATVGILVVLLVASVGAGRELSSADDPDPLRIKVIGHQWWWEVQYPGSDPSKLVTTANEIHVPAGKTVKFELGARDVIHSFWIPNLHGKRDLIPGHDATLILRADRPGIYRGQCAEFCGYQHAHMNLSLVVDPPAEFAAWLDHQRAPAREPTTPLEERGRAVFLAGPCALCHTVQGTAAAATAGPDLTHVAARGTLASGTLPNGADPLRSWIADPQSIKPGSYMPRTALSPGDLDALVAYLGGLK